MDRPVASKVLVADDEFLIRWSISESLKREGHVTKIVENGLKALDLLKEESFDFVVTDIFMPEIDGWTLLERVRAECPYTKVIVITAIGSMEMENKAKELGAFGFVEKPHIIDGIKKIIREGA